MRTTKQLLVGALMGVVAAACGGRVDSSGEPGVEATEQATRCVDSVVMVHGNAGYPSNWDNTYYYFLSQGYVSSQISRPSWGSKICPECNTHDSTNTSVIINAMRNAIGSSCTGRIDVLAHSMGVTLAMKAINDAGLAGRVDSFVGIAGAQHGLTSCGVYPFNVQVPTCGSEGLSIESPLVNSVRNRRYGTRMFSIKSYVDEIVCAAGCYVYGSHTSNIDLQNGSDTYVLGHMQLQSDTASRQYALVQ